MSRPRLIETWKFGGCRDRDSSRLGNLLDVETETSRDWAKDVDTETPSRLSLISGMNVIIGDIFQLSRMIYNENYQTNSNFFGHPVLMVKATDILKTDEEKPRQPNLLSL